jgi:hypothetical protein
MARKQLFRFGGLHKMLHPPLKEQLVEQVLHAIYSRGISYDDQTDVLSLIALDANYRTHLVASAVRKLPAISALVSLDLSEVAEAALLKHLETETVELTPQGEVERPRAEAARA